MGSRVWRLLQRTKTVGRRGPIDPLQAGEIVAVRVLPNGNPICLDDIRDPRTGQQDISITIGAGPDVDIRVRKEVDAGVSELHCLLYRDGGQTFAEDDSKNGTWIGRSRIRRARVEVFPGQVLEIGERTDILLCNEHLSNCPADIIATTLDGFRHAARMRYGALATVARFINVPFETLRRWYRKEKRAGRI